MQAQAQANLVSEIIKSWLLPKSNYILVCPPMNAERRIIDSLTCRYKVCEVIGESYKDLAIAKLDTSDFRDEIKFAKSVALKWGVESIFAGDNDPHSILENACETIRAENRSPIIIINRFHEALDKLGEDIGSTLRNLEHSHKLKTVVTMPVSLSVLRDRWSTMDPDKAPFLASDWGQGHRNKLLKGYSLAEVVELGAERGLQEDQCQALFKATGGMVDIVDHLIEEVSGKKGKGLTLYLQSRSSELCERPLSWLDPKSASQTYKKSIISLLNSKFYPSALAFISYHDWSPILLNKDNQLNFEMLAWAASNKMSKSLDESLLSTLREMYASEQFDPALEMIEVIYGADRENFSYWSSLRDITIFCKASSDVFSNNGQWLIARRKLKKVLDATHDSAVHEKITSKLESWRPLAEMLSDYFSHISAKPDARLESYICLRADRALVVPFLQLLSLRLEYAKNVDAFHSLQAILTAPESLLQIYAYFELDICFWDFKGLDVGLDQLLEEIAKKPYKISTGILGYSDLAHLILLYTTINNTEGSLISTREELVEILEYYEVRKSNAHSVTFTESKTFHKYGDFLSSLMNRYAALLSMNSVKLNLIPPHSLALDILEYAPRNPC